MWPAELLDCPVSNRNRALRRRRTSDVVQVEIEVGEELAAQLGAQHEDVARQLILGADAADGAFAAETEEALVRHQAVERLAEAIEDFGGDDGARRADRQRARGDVAPVEIAVVAAEVLVVPIDEEAQLALAGGRLAPEHVGVVVARTPMPPSWPPVRTLRVAIVAEGVVEGLERVEAVEVVVEAGAVDRARRSAGAGRARSRCRDSCRSRRRRCPCGSRSAAAPPPARRSPNSVELTSTSAESSTTCTRGSQALLDRSSSMSLRSGSMIAWYTRPLVVADTMATSPPLFQLQVDLLAADRAHPHGHGLGERPRADAANGGRAAVAAVLGDVVVGRLDPVVDRRDRARVHVSSRARRPAAPGAPSAMHSRSGNGDVRQPSSSAIEHRRTELVAQLGDHHAAGRARVGEGPHLGVQRVGLLGAGKNAPTKGIFGVLSNRSTTAKMLNRSIQS